MSSSHPYRQNAPSNTVQSVPFPIDDEQYESHQPQPHEYIGDNLNVGNHSSHIDDSYVSPNHSAPLDHQYSSEVSDSSLSPAFQSPTVDLFPTLPGQESVMTTPLKNAPHGLAPYPEYGAQTPPPVFATSPSALPKLHSHQEPIHSPPSNVSSSTSSVTNLNLNRVSNSHNVYSKSETNLAVGKVGHQRSSSNMSLLYDKSDNASMVDFSQNLIQQYLGNNSSNLMPRIKTIELYRKNAKKSNDPTVLFQYAQYMLQTALLLDDTSGNTVNTPKDHGENSTRKGTGNSLAVKHHRKSRSTNSIEHLSLSGGDVDKIDDKKLKKALLKEAVHYLKRLSDKGYTEAQYLLADAYSSGALERVENREAFVLFSSAAKHGHVESAYRTSYCYEEGLGTGRDARKAIEFLKIAAAKNHPAAMYKLGVYSFYGRMGLPSNVTTKKLGIKWLERASNIANELIAAAPYELGKIYFNGFQDIVIPDKKYALELYSQAAALGHVQSAALLGHFYEVGEIVGQDSNLSIHYYTEAALGGDPESMLAMCAWYLVGSEPYLPKDESEAFEWAKRAAMCNLPKAQFALANFYEKGIGCMKNTAEAQSWYNKAAENGDEKSLARMNDKELATKLEKKLRKKKSNNVVAAANANGVGGSSAAQDKDCVIM